MSTIPVGILGATGMVGQQFIALLANHPWFRVEWLGASQRSEGKAFRDAAAWRLARPLPDDVANRIVEAATPGRAPKLVFSGLDSSVAGEIETAFAEAGHIIVSNSRNHRMEPNVPLLIPEVNADHLALLDVQGAGGWKGRIVTNPNCAVVVMAMALAPLRQFGLKTTMITTLQAISGAGYPGVASWDILANVIPHIGGGEEEKVETEAKKILGSLNNGAVSFHPVVVSATTTRGAGPQRTHRFDRGRSGAETDARRDHRRLAIVQRTAAGAGAAVGAAAADRVPAGSEPAAALARRRP